ncbi:MAG: hypothetical protein Q9197_004292, partial [Variospora fuerteventurae]
GFKMRCVADRDVLEDDITVAGRPPSRGVDRPGWLLLEMEELNDAFDGDEVHLKLTIALAELNPAMEPGNLRDRSSQLEAAMSTKAVKPGDTPVYRARRVNKKVEIAERASKRYISHACRLLRSGHVQN